MNRKPTYFKIFTLDEKQEVKTYRIPNSAIRFFDMKLERVGDKINAIDGQCFSFKIYYQEN